ncbi:GNAT family N-acetyltransferase [Paracnuella aquatica]|uniref:GNAT family N-acetyltransferase n=1 Tax=Paracnuella aquatica TaxID=2268757 RepID=UPI000DEEE4DC|nr:GNAT family N-acetyltransferase [Paracnuella aquatica]RPD43779.1 GNAT family N-acetyltransferase [Paracnuella aquatica]
MPVNIQILDANNLTAFKGLIAVFERSFEMAHFRMPADAHLKSVLSRDHFFAVVASVDGNVVGGLTFYVLDQYYAEKPLAYIYDLAVLPEYQRMGIGKKLIDTTNEYCRQQGFEEVFVQADKVDAHALLFYRATKPTEEEEVVHFYYTLPQQ